MSATHTTPPIPRLELKEMDGAMLAFELTRELARIFPADEFAREFVTSSAMVATQLHRGQTRLVRKKFPKVPYIEHPLRVILRLIRWGSDDCELLAAAMLHDTVEDCATEIVKLYLAEVTGGAQLLHAQTSALHWVALTYSSGTASIVQWVTNPPAPASYHEHLQLLAAGGISNRRPLLVKAADLVDNPGSLVHQYGHVPDSFIAGKVYKYHPNVAIVADALRAIAASAAAAGARDLVAEAAVEALDAVTAQLEKLAVYLGLDLKLEV